MDSDSIKDEIKRRVKIEDVVSQHVTLQRAGSRLKARCPFHEEKTPSFYVNPALGLYKCFGCGAGGDVFDFVMRIEGLTFPEAGERLAERCGLQWRVQPGEEARAKRRELVRRANDLAAAHYQEMLLAPPGAAALEYLRGRGFSDETIARFRLGFAPEAWEGLLRILRQKGIDESIAAEAGLARERTSGGHYDVFRNRVMFPIIDAGDRVVGFGGRALDPDDPAKYLNTPETAMFKKGRQVYALNLARGEITRAKSVIIVEGYTDVLALHQAGIGNVVACLGTALTQDHLDLLSRLAEEIVLAYDADTAGMNAAARNVPMLEACAAEVRIVVLPPGLDPDECVKRDGPEGFLALLANRTTPVEYLIDLEFARHEDQGPDGLMRAAKAAVDVLVGVRDRARLDEYVRRVGDRWSEGNPARGDAIEWSLRDELGRRLGARQAPGAVRPESPRDRRFITEAVSRLAGPVLRDVVKTERNLLTAALSDHHAAVAVSAGLPCEQFCDEAHRLVAQAIAAALDAGGSYSAGGVMERLPDEGAARELALELACADPEEMAQEDIGRDLAKLRAYHRAGRYRGDYDVPCGDESDEPDPVEDFRALESEAARLLNEGADPNHPVLERYRRLMRQIRGAGALSVWEYKGPLGAHAPGVEIAPSAAAGEPAPGREIAPQDEGS